ncbi:MAG: hypothetical protein A2677_00965 [Candidatus Komeilibacteria bacterium RIFCSPHIGHO2_01_FULL_52_14]|uniref:Uncharacterized protein n=1 Tax=Candidatus Komeilibacteria bacterium RIFCSPHIGHO2_01_FULL_52_14 TaxID=1798549 RepID=A0A1G2BLL8_9BACT|nr:MAG: hypothetical protein A2677_00965 [Candidatus Komeilibacteria bacterium RIFCSPHIGHO2_01_FULL_52_14]
MQSCACADIRSDLQGRHRDSVTAQSRGLRVGHWLKVALVLIGLFLVGSGYWAWAFIILGTVLYVKAHAMGYGRKEGERSMIGTASVRCNGVLCLGRYCTDAHCLSNK